jgi:hypothetical protein
MKKAYICSPYRGDVKRNKAYARQLVRFAANCGCAPICPHLYLTEALNDDDPAERATGLNIGLELLAACEVVIVGEAYGISEGMLAEIEQAERLGLLLVNVNEV